MSCRGVRRRFSAYLDQDLPADSDRWGVLCDHILRRFDGATTVREMADEAGLPFGPVRDYVQRFAEAGLVELAPADLGRPELTRAATPAATLASG